MSDSPNPYDRVPYESYPYAETHPNHLSVVASLFGLRAQFPDNCKVLELGCCAAVTLSRWQLRFLAATSRGSTIRSAKLTKRCGPPLRWASAIYTSTAETSRQWMAK